jgi:hypothetical protein
MGWAPNFFSSPPVRREMEHRREEPVSGLAGLRCLQSEVVGWASKITAARERNRGEGEKDKAQRSGEKNMGIFYMVL